MSLPAILTAALATIASGDAGPSYGQDVAQTVQTVLIPDPSTWKSVVFAIGGKVQFNAGNSDDRLEFQRGAINTTILGITMPYGVEAAAGPARFFFGNVWGTCKMERNQLVIHFPARGASEDDPGCQDILWILEPQKR